MAVTQIAFTTFRIYDRQTPQVVTAVGSTFEALTPSGTSAATTTAIASGQSICRVSTDTAVYVAFGSAPTASSTTGFYIPAGGTDCFAVAGGDKAAVILA